MNEKTVSPELKEIAMQLAIEAEDLERYPDYDISYLYYLLTNIKGCKGSDCECKKS